MELGGREREYLAEAIPHLPGRQDGYVTLDLNGQVIVTANTNHSEPRATSSLVIRALAYTGLRIGKLVSLRWKDIDKSESERSR